MNTEGWIFGKGPQSAKIMIIGEMPSKSDEQNNQVFSGLGGDLVEEMLETGGVSKSAVYLTNLIKKRCESYEIEEYFPLLLEEVGAVNPNVIIGLGETVLKTLTSKEGIRNYRGSILPCHHTNHPLKVIPTIPPAALFEFKPKINKEGKRNTNAEGMFSFKQKIHIQLDFLKAIKQSAFPEFTTRQRDIRSVRSSLHLEQFLKSYSGYSKCYLDCEVYLAHLVCLGIAFTPDEAISIPLIDLKSNFSKHGEGIPMNEMLEIWKILDIFLRSDVGKVGQNFKGDKLYWLEESGFVVNNFIYDAMLKFHTISPELPKSLAFQCSVLTDEPYYKHEGREYNPHHDRMDVLLHYNGMDCCINCECDEAMQEDLVENGLVPFFEFVCEASPIYEQMEKRGLRVDLVRKAELSLRYKEMLVDRKKLFTEAVGHDCNFNSPKQITNLMYIELKLPKRKSVDDQDLTAIKHKIKDQRRKDIIQLTLDQRKIHKIKGTFIDAHEDPDGRMRFTYNQVGTETGRTSTGIIKSPARNAKWGVSLHALPKHGEFGHDVRSMFIPDPNMVFMEFDQSQAEARIVALLANDLELLNLFDIDDVHKLTASYVFGIPKESVDEEQRQIGKKGRHAVNYRSSPENLAVEISISLYRARLTCDKIAEMSPNIVNVFHADIESALANSRIFWTPFGRRREFFDKWGRDLFKEATAHLPQSTVGDNTKRAMIALQRLKAKWFDILTETHDAFTIQVQENSMEDMYYLSKEAFEQPIDFTRCTLPRDPITIPVDCKVGYNLTDLKKWKP